MGTANQKEMKLGPDINLLNTFGLSKNEGVNMWEGGGGRGGEWHVQRKTRKCHENNILNLTSLNNILQNAMKVGISLM